MGGLAAATSEDGHVGGDQHGEHCGHEGDEEDMEVVKVGYELAEHPAENGDNEADLGREGVRHRRQDADAEDRQDRKGDDGVHVLQELEDAAHVRQLRRDHKGQQRACSAEGRRDVHHPLIRGLAIDEGLVELQAEQGRGGIQRRVERRQHAAQEHRRERAQGPRRHYRLDQLRVHLVGLLHPEGGSVDFGVHPDEQEADEAW
mmetsp:Transcript_65822/g.189784  ORF Transcript_65822/g.189784 Transcript_65822/m.189784 type:complete len:203 (-) Transcript_65822:286-894(-)